MSEAVLDILLLEYIATILTCLFLTLVAYWQNVLDAKGSLAAFCIGVVIGVTADFLWLVLLLIFLATSFVATKYRFALKTAMGVQEGRKGERGWRNVLANGLPAAIIAVLSSKTMNIPYLASMQISGILFLTALSVAASDTIASELGVFSKNTYLITEFKKVKPGTNGGVSALGTFCAFLAATYTAVVGFAFFSLSSVTSLGVPVRLLIPLLAGFLGCHVDSLMGATLEDRGLTTKGLTNFISISIGAVVAFEVMIWTV